MNVSVALIRGRQHPQLSTGEICSFFYQYYYRGKEVEIIFSFERIEPLSQSIAIEVVVIATRLDVIGLITDRLSSLSIA